MHFNPSVTFGVLAYRFPNLLDPDKFASAVSVMIVVGENRPTFVLYLDHPLVPEDYTKDSLLDLLKSVDREPPMFALVENSSRSGIASYVIGTVVGFAQSFLSVVAGSRSGEDVWDTKRDTLTKPLAAAVGVLLDEKNDVRNMPAVVILDPEQMKRNGPSASLTQDWVVYQEK